MVTGFASGEENQNENTSIDEDLRKYAAFRMYDILKKTTAHE